jgi:hypothetical protein
MRLKSVFGILLMLVVLDVSFAIPAFGAQKVTVKCSVPNGANIASCDYRHAADVKVQGIALLIDSVPRKVSGAQPFIKTGKSTAILFLIDTSDPSREKTVIRNVYAVREMVSHLRPQDQFGLAVFDQGIHLVAPLGSSREQLEAALGRVKASGLSTEFYKSVIDGVSTLKAFPADRKGMVLMSDGKAEDPTSGYNETEAVNAAHQSGVAILGLGYAERPQEAARLQTIERLAQNTGGQFYAMQSSDPLPVQLSANPAAFLQGGGKFEFQTGDLYGTKIVSLNLKKDDGTVITEKQKINFNDSRNIIANFIAFYRDYPVRFFLGCLGIIAISALSILYFRNRRKREGRVVFGWLEDLGANGARYPLKGTSIRIGRGSDNDIRFENSSISSHHATIVRRDDITQIIDLESTNGLLVNDAPTKQALLHSGDLIELGEVRLRFTENTNL